MTAIVLAPIDITDAETTKKVLEAAVAQTKAVDGELHVMTVVPDIVSGLDWRYAIRGETGGSAEFDMSKVVAECLERLNKIIADQTPAGMSAKTIARHGTVYEQVLKVAEDIGADQIVMGAHRPGLGDFLLGPNTARIVRHATCSVNVIRI
ncbi:universal stress protein [Pelagibius sp. Alg239-R121]|uniref:universal stress protein n=1 Tax=Pelagibius sp. Alg239-R121 TaxID=2993448 RepID=UPI0024A6D2CD|nr:universal stress protein [Pelagibius sp. Alg239-R121]